MASASTIWSGPSGRVPAGRHPLVGDVAEFDDPRGLGVIEFGTGHRIDFHCTAITDGSRHIDVGTVVAFEVSAGRLGRLEAHAVRPLPGVPQPGATLIQDGVVEPGTGPGGDLSHLEPTYAEPTYTEPVGGVFPPGALQRRTTMPVRRRLTRSPDSTLPSNCPAGRRCAGSWSATPASPFRRRRLPRPRRLSSGNRRTLRPTVRSIGPRQWTPVWDPSGFRRRGHRTPRQRYRTGWHRLPRPTTPPPAPLPPAPLPAPVVVRWTSSRRHRWRHGGSSLRATRSRPASGHSVAPTVAPGAPPGRNHGPPQPSLPPMSCR